MVLACLPRVLIRLEVFVLMRMAMRWLVGRPPVSPRIYLLLIRGFQLEHRYIPPSRSKIQNSPNRLLRCLHTHLPKLYKHRVLFLEIYRPLLRRSVLRDSRSSLPNVPITMHLAMRRSSWAGSAEVHFGCHSHVSIATCYPREH